MSTRGYCGCTMNLVGTKVLLNVAEKWRTVEYSEISKDFGGILADTEEEDAFMLWHKYPLVMEELR